VNIIRDIDLSNIEIFAGLSNKVIEEIKKSCRVRRYNEGKILFFTEAFYNSEIYQHNFLALKYD